MTVVACVERLALIEDTTILGAHEHARHLGGTPALGIDRGVFRELAKVVPLVTGVVADRRSGRAALLHARAGSVRIDGVGHGSSEHG